VYFIAAALRAQGYQVEVSRTPIDPDVLIIQKRIDSVTLAAAKGVRARGGRVVYDLDDFGIGLGWLKIDPRVEGELLSLVDTLVVDTVGYNEKFWIDTKGTPHTKYLHFIERFTRKDFNTLEYQATIDDPGAYTQTWTTQVFTMRWQADSDLFEYVCQDNNHGPEMMIGSQEEVDRTRLFVP